MEAQFSAFASLPTRRPLGDANTDPGTEPVSRFWLRWVKCHSEREEDKTARLFVCWQSQQESSEQCHVSHTCPAGSVMPGRGLWLPPQGVSMLQTKCLLDLRAASHLPDVQISVTFLHMQQLASWDYKQCLSFSFELCLSFNKFGLYSSTECNTSLIHTGVWMRL